MRSSRRMIPAAVAVLLIAASARADERLVGKLGDPTHIAFEGVESFPVDELRSALGGDFDVLLTTYPETPLDEHLRAVERKLTLGYRHSGFAHARVSVRLDEARHAIVARVEEGARYCCGGVKVVAGEGISSDEIVAALVGGGQDAWPPKGVQQLARGETPTDPKSFAPPEDTRTWKPGQPASFVEHTWKQHDEGIRQGLAAQGYFYADFHAEVRPDETGDEATLWVFVDDPGYRATIGEIRIEGATRHTPQQIIDFLGLQSGMSFDGRLKAEIERRLYESARFLESSVAIAPPFGEGAPATLNIAVKDAPAGSLLDEELTQREQVALRVGEWLRQWHGGDEDLVITGSGRSGEAHSVEGTVVFSPGKGMLLDVEAHRTDGKPLCSYLVLVRHGRCLIESRHRGTQLDWTVPDGAVLSVPFTVSLKDVEGELKRWLEFGWKVHTGEHAAGRPPVSVRINVAPVVARDWAHQAEWTYAIRDGICTVTEPGRQIEVDCATGRLLRFENTFAEPSETEDRSAVSIAVVSGEFDRRVQELEKRGWEDEVATGAAAPVTEVGLFLAGEAEHFLAENADERDACAIVGKLLRHGMLRPLDRWLGQDHKPTASDDAFSIPYEPPGPHPNPQAMMFEGLARFLLPLHCGLFPERSTPWTVGREAAFLASGRGRFAGRELHRVLVANQHGPLSDLHAALLLGLFDPQWRHEFATHGLERLTIEDFRRDYPLLLRLDNPVGELVRSTADAVRHLEDDEIRQLARWLNQKQDESTREAAIEAATRILLRLKSAPEKPVDEVLPLVLDEMWERGLRDALEQSLRALAAPPAPPAAPQPAAVHADAGIVPRFE